VSARKTCAPETSARAVTPVGLTAAVWSPALRSAPGLGLPQRMDGEHVLLAGAHADDETLGAGGLVQAMHQRGARFSVLIATDGAAAFPGLSLARRQELARVRQDEARSALAALGIPRPDVTFLGLPDGEADRQEDEIAFALMSLGARCGWWVVPWQDDPHPDHRAVGRAAVRSRPSGQPGQPGQPGIRLLQYPIWMRHSLRPRDPRVPREALQVLHLNRGQHRRKQRAIAAHRSQTQVWEPGYEPVLPGHVLSLFAGRHEPFFVEVP
jgi:LmbE family N-acetylglucosaminyl deacetylase